MLIFDAKIANNLETRQRFRNSSHKIISIGLGAIVPDPIVPQTCWLHPRRRHLVLRSHHGLHHRLRHAECRRHRLHLRQRFYGRYGRRYAWRRLPSRRLVNRTPGTVPIVRRFCRRSAVLKGARWVAQQTQQIKQKASVESQIPRRFSFLCAHTIRKMQISLNNISPIQYLSLTLHPQTESPRCKGGEVAYI